MKFYNLILLSCAAFFFVGHPTEANAAVSTEHRAITLTEVYGNREGKILLTIGNGGAGPTCLLQALSEDFLQTEKLKGKIGWIQTISRLTLENLREKNIDISLTYEVDPELKAIQEGWAIERTLVFNDHFLIVGPKRNPAKILPSDTPEKAFEKIAAHGGFISRNDFSGSHQRELSFWKAIGVNPSEKFPSTYIKDKVFPADALLRADREGLYTLTDRGTLIAVHDKLKQTAVYVQENDRLMNRCHAMLHSQSSPQAKLFLSYLKSPRAQALIARYAGKNKEDCKDCCPLFTSANEDKFLERDCLERTGLAPSTS